MPDGAEYKDLDQPAATALPSERRRTKVKAGTPDWAPRRLSELEPAERRWAMVRSVVILIVFWSCLIAVYYAIPEASDDAADAFPRLAVGLLIFAALLAWQNSRIGRVELPELRAARSLGSAIPLFLTVFATIYLSLSHTSAANFSQRLDHTRALYFTVTVFSTVGFGDITPTTDAAESW
jgi:voltage-gated potassium channel